MIPAKKVEEILTKVEQGSLSEEDNDVLEYIQENSESVADQFKTLGPRGERVLFLLSKLLKVAPNVKETRKFRLVSSLAGLDEQLKDDFLSSDSIFIAKCEKLAEDRGYPLTDVLEAYENRKATFVLDYFEKEASRSNPIQLSLEQARAIASTTRDTRVLARAGSGKTSVVVYRAFFLIRHCRVPASSLLLLAFNRKAVSEIRKRLIVDLSDISNDELLKKINSLRMVHSSIRDDVDLMHIAIDEIAESKNIILPNVMTFHSLGMAINKPVGRVLIEHDINDAIKDVLTSFIRDAKYSKQIESVMKSYFKSDWESLEEGGYLLGDEKFKEYRNSVRYLTYRDDRVKSDGERIIANVLFANSIKNYSYERRVLEAPFPYSPDFTIFRSEQGFHKIIIEYFGIRGDQKYQNEILEKRRFWGAEKNATLIEVYPEDISPSNIAKFEIELIKKLTSLGVKSRKLTDKELWDGIKERAAGYFEASIQGFIQKCRQRSINVSELLDRVNKFNANYPFQKDFYYLAVKVYELYLLNLENELGDDFSGVLSKAAQKISSGSDLVERKGKSFSIKDLRFIFIDEYQDFSPLYWGLISSIKDQNEKLNIFSVGDDWQAINGFSGSDLKFFDNFEKYFPTANLVNLTTNYRSLVNIVNASNNLMSGLGPLSKSYSDYEGNVFIADLNDLNPNGAEMGLIEGFGGSIKSAAILRIVEKIVKKGRKVVLLSRTNQYEGFRSLKDFLDTLKLQLPSEYRDVVSIATVHKYKGLECDAAILIDAVDGRFPFIHPNWFFEELFGQSIPNIIAEERRLFYVAMTRAVSELYLLTDLMNLSPFIKDLLSKDDHINIVNWHKYPPNVTGNDLYVLSVSEAYEVREMLKRDGFKWNPSDKAWEKTVNTLDISQYKNASWSKNGSFLKVELVDSRDHIQKSYSIHSGEWYLSADGKST